MGWLLLSAKPDAEIDKLRRRINAEEADAAKLSQDALMEIIQDVRAKGYAFSKHTVSDGAGVIGALLPPSPHGRVYAIGVAGPVSRLERKEAMILAELRAGVAGLAA
jgi:DNA-binding IclR family transcriptional regulator